MSNDTEMVNFVVALILVASVTATFAGYRMAKAVYALSAFGMTAATIYGLAEPHVNPEGVLIALSLAGGFAAAVLAIVVYAIGIFFVGIILGIFVIGILVPDAKPWLEFLAGVAGGVVAIFAERIFMITATSLVGSWLSVSCAAWFADLTMDPYNPFELLNQGSTKATCFFAAWVILSISGWIMQYRKST